MFDENALTAIYQRILERSLEPGVPQFMAALSEAYVNGTWRGYIELFSDIQRATSLQGATVADIGCKCGHLAPLFIAHGAAKVWGVDVDDTYLAGACVVANMCPEAVFVKTVEGYMPIGSESVDLVFVNEVISHVNPSYLDALYSEIARVLRPGGYVFISDGNNIADPTCRPVLVDLYEKWENGPDGAKTDRDVVNKCFRTRRREIVEAEYPAVDSATAEYLAANTSGLFGATLRREIERYIKTGTLVERPYRRGQCPTNPCDYGALMERGFRPEQVEMDLAEHGIMARQILPGDLNPRKIERRRGESWNFRILGRRAG